MPQLNKHVLGMPLGKSQSQYALFGCLDGMCCAALDDDLPASSVHVVILACTSA